MDQSLKHRLTVGAAQLCIGQALWVRHHAKHRFTLVIDTGDSKLRAVGICGIGHGTRFIAIVEGDAARVFKLEAS